MSLVGAPGMGKSRLLDEFRQRLTEQPVRYAEGHCLAYGSGTPYLPILDLLREHCGIVAQDPPDTRIRQLRTSLEQVRLDAEASLPYLLDLLGLPIASDQVLDLRPEARKVRTFETVRQLFLMSSQHHPLVLAIENLHWIDPTSETLLGTLVDGLAGAAILLLTTCRPGYRPPWLDKSYATQIALQPLGLDESRQVVRRVMRDTPLTVALEQQLLTRAEGNPFFLEELAYTVREHGEGHSALAVPDTIQAVLAARLDRLPTLERQLLQAAAVIGKDVAVPLLQAIAERPEAALQRGLAHLQAAEFLYETQVLPERAYTFKHALTQEVAYGSLLPEQRRLLHARIVEALEALAGDRGAAPVEGLAHHALRGEVWDRAVAYGRQAGEKAQTRSAYREAVVCFEQALVALEHLPDSRAATEQAIDLQLALSTTLNALGEAPGRMLDHLRRAETLAQTLDDHLRLVRVYADMGVIFRVASDVERAIDYGQRTLALAATLGHVGLQVRAHLSLGQAYYDAGDYPRAVESLGRNVATLQGDLRYERFGTNGSVAAASRAWLSWCHAERGAFREGLAMAEEGLRISETAKSPFTQIGACFGVSVVYLRQGHVQRAIPMLERGIGLCQDWHIPVFVPLQATALGVAYALDGRVAAGLALVERGVEQEVAKDRSRRLALFVACLSEAYLLAGRLEEACQRAAQAVDLACQFQQRGKQAWALWLLGESTARQESSAVEPAAGYYRQALALADELGMRPLQAHCHRGLGLLYRETGQPAQARTELVAAIALYRAMEMTFWLPETQAALAQVQGDHTR